MVNSSSIAFIVFSVEFVTRSLAQVGFLLQKLAHRDIERQKLDQQLQNELDNISAGKTYCSWKWVLGLAFVTLNVCCHSVIVPFCDLTLLSCNAASAIIVNLLLSTRFLGETFVCRYDLTAMLLIATGSITIVINAHTEQVDFSAEEIRHLLLEPRTIIYLTICIILFACETCMLKYFYRRMR